MGVHKKTKQFSCQLCGKSFERYDTLRRHLLTKHQHEKMVKYGLYKTHLQTSHITSYQYYECQHCNTTFSCAQDLKQHIQSTHEKPTNTTSNSITNHFLEVDDVKEDMKEEDSGENQSVYVFNLLIKKEEDDLVQEEEKCIEEDNVK